MTITISSELETRLIARGESQGVDLDAIVESVLVAALEEESRDRADAILGIQRGLDAGATGRVRPAGDVLADMRARLARE